MFFKTMIKAFNGENKKNKKHSQTRDIHSSIIKALKAFSMFTLQGHCKLNMAMFIKSSRVN